MTSSSRQLNSNFRQQNSLPIVPFPRHHNFPELLPSGINPNASWTQSDSTFSFYRRLFRFVIFTNWKIHKIYVNFLFKTLFLFRKRFLYPNVKFQTTRFLKMNVSLQARISFQRDFPNIFPSLFYSFSIIFRSTIVEWKFPFSLSLPLTLWLSLSKVVSEVFVILFLLVPNI